MRTKGKLKPAKSDAIVDENKDLIVIVFGPNRDRDRDRIVKCWNAFEEDGVVAELVKACEAIIASDTKNVIMHLKLYATAFEQAKSALERYKQNL